MRNLLVEFLKAKETEAIRIWVDALANDSLMRAALPQGTLLPLVKETYREIIDLIDNGEAHLETFSGFASIQDQHISGIDTLLGLQRLLLQGKRTFFTLAASRIEDRQIFISLFQNLDEAFHHFILRITSYYTLKCISPLYNSPSAPNSHKDIYPSRLNLFYNAFQNSTDGIIITDTKGRITEANKAFIDLFGYEYEEVIGRRTSLLRSSNTTDEFYKHMWDSIKTAGSWKGEIVNRKKNGEEIPVLLSVTPIYENEQVVGYMGIEIDRRQQKEMEERLLLSERLAVIGQMASKVAHEIRNPLSSISLNAELLEDEIQAVGKKACGDAQVLLGAIMAEVDRLTLLTEEYLQFSRLPHPTPEKADFVNLAREVIGFMETEANSIGIQLLATFGNNLPKLTFDPQQIRRLLLNLLRNAMEAMPGGGVIRIAVNKHQQAIRTVISDTGHGISKEDIGRIFEPFFTTKDLGTGLGLALCAQIIREHGGTIDVESKEKVGTTFSFELPLQSGEPPMA